jgi:hypothetical protein
MDHCDAGRTLKVADHHVGDLGQRLDDLTDGILIGLWGYDD